MDEQGKVDLATAPVKCIGEEEDADKNAELSNQKEQCPVFHTEAMRLTNTSATHFCETMYQ